MHVHEASQTPLVHVFDDAVNLGEQSVIASQADVLAGLDLGAALPHQNRTAAHQVASEALGAQPLGLGIAAVPRTAESFFMCHYATSIFSIFTVVKFWRWPRVRLCCF